MEVGVLVANDVHYLPPISRVRSRSASSYEHHPLPDPILPHSRAHALSTAGRRQQQPLAESDQLETFADSVESSGSNTYLSHSPSSSGDSHSLSLQGHRSVGGDQQKHDRLRLPSFSNQTYTYQQRQRFPQKTPPSSRPGSRLGSHSESQSSSSARAIEVATAPTAPVSRPGSRGSRPGSRNRLVHPSGNFVTADSGNQHHGKSRIPTRPRAYSAPALDTEELTDGTDAPPLPDMSMTESYRLGALGPNGAAGSPSHIPVLKSRIRTTSLARVPSPDLPELTDRLADVTPPFRVDLDAALAEIEDELEARANERFRKAQPAPSTPSPTLSTSPAVGVRAPQAVKNNTATRRKANGVSAGSISKASGTASPRTPRTPKSQQRASTSLVRSSSMGPATVDGGSLTGRKRLASDATPSSLRSGGKIPRPRPKARTSSVSAALPSPAHSNTVTTPISTPNSTSTRPGLAAHWVPPESSFTPPKDADWDDVVLPTIAKKLGISTLSASGHAASHSVSSAHDVGRGGASANGHGAEDELAVEWDKNGTPIRWEKQRPKPREDAIEMSPLRTSMAATSEFGAMSAPPKPPPAQMPMPQPTGQQPQQPQGPAYGQAPQAPLQQPPPSQVKHHFNPGEMERPRPAPIPPQEPMPVMLTAPVEKPTASGKKKNKRAEDDVKGCACVIM